MTELMLAIAAVCAIHSSHDSTLAIARQQTECQAFYAKCLTSIRPLKNFEACSTEYLAALK